MCFLQHLYFSLSKTSLYSGTLAKICVFNRPLLFSSWNLLHFPPTHHQFLWHWFVSEIWEGFHVYKMVKSSLSSSFSGAIHFLWMYLYNAIIFILLIQRPIKCIQRGIVAKFGKILRKKNLNYFWIFYLFWEILHICISSNHSEVAWNPNLKCKEDKFPSCWVSINCHIFIAHQRYSVHIFSLIFLFQIFAP